MSQLYEILYSVLMCITIQLMMYYFWIMRALPKHRNIHLDFHQGNRMVCVIVEFLRSKGIKIDDKCLVDNKIAQSRNTFIMFDNICIGLFDYGAIAHVMYMAWYFRDIERSIGVDFMDEKCLVKLLRFAKWYRGDDRRNMFFAYNSVCLILFLCLMNVIYYTM